MIRLITKVWYDPGVLSIDIGPQYDVAVSELVRRIGREGMAKLEITKWHRSRSTGWKSQNHHIRGHEQQIAMELGQDLDTIHAYMKQQAIGRGYPYEMFNAVMIPYSESKIDTLQASYLIDEIHQFAAEYGINLKEDD